MGNGNHDKFRGLGQFNETCPDLMHLSPWGLGEQPQEKWGHRTFPDIMLCIPFNSLLPF